MQGKGSKWRAGLVKGVLEGMRNVSFEAAIDAKRRRGIVDHVLEETFGSLDAPTMG
jgi:hypothetical protein